MARDKPPTSSLYPRESFLCFFLFIVELAAVSAGFTINLTEGEDITVELTVVSAGFTINLTWQKEKI